MRKLLGAALFIATCNALTLPAHAIEYGGFGIRPANPRPDNPRTESIFIHNVSPGQVVEEGVLVVNNKTTPITVQLYATDSTPSTDGAFACEQFLDEKNDVGTWIALEKSELTLAPATSETVKFSITVPADPPVGENDGCIMVQEKKETNESGSGAHLAVRSGLRVALTVSGDIRRGLDFVDLVVLYNELSDGKNVITLKPIVKNTGNVSVDADIKVVTRYWTGWKFIQFGGEYPILARRTSEWNFELPDSFWGGLMFASASTTYDANPDAEVGKNTKGKLELVRGPVKVFWVWPTLWGGLMELLLLVILAGAVFLLWLKRKQNQWMQGEWQTYKVKEGDNIVKLGTRFNVNWNLIALRNKIKKPYILEAGTTIFVPDEDKKAEPTSRPRTVKKPALAILIAEKGDTLRDVADFAGITVKELAKLNHIKNPRTHKLRAGDELIVPE